MYFLLTFEFVMKMPEMNKYSYSYMTISLN